MLHKLKKIIGVFLITLIIATIGYVSTSITTTAPIYITEKIDTTSIPKIEYGIYTGSLIVYKGEIKPNQFLADILLKYHISYPEIDKIVKEAKDVFDVRKLMVGRSYTIFCSNDSIEKAKYFIYEPSSIDYVVFDMNDTLNIYKKQKEVTTVISTATGVINSSLYMTLSDNNISPLVAIKLSEVYAWSIDFYRIQKGDRFKIIYEEKFVEDESIGIGKIIAAYFNHRNTDFYAFYYDQDKGGDYFDDEANSLRKAFLQSPLKFSRISSKFSLNRFHPVQKRWKAHLGTDYAAPTGTPIMSTGDGVVVEATYKKANGNYVKIRHNGTYTTQYLHMSSRAKGMRPGKAVRQGEVIGYVGSTGLATGPHVCYRFWKNEKQVDPFKEKIPPSEPISKKYIESFNVLKEKLKSQLNELEFEENDKVITVSR